MLSLLRSVKCCILHHCLQDHYTRWCTCVKVILWKIPKICNSQHRVIYYPPSRLVTILKFSLYGMNTFNILLWAFTSLLHKNLLFLEVHVCSKHLQLPLMIFSWICLQISTFHKKSSMSEGTCTCLLGRPATKHISSSISWSWRGWKGLLVNSSVCVCTC